MSNMTDKGNTSNWFRQGVCSPLAIQRRKVTRKTSLNRGTVALSPFSSRQTLGELSPSIYAPDETRPVARRHSFCMRPSVNGGSANSSFTEDSVSPPNRHTPLKVSFLPNIKRALGLDTLSPHSSHRPSSVRTHTSNTSCQSVTDNNLPGFVPSVKLNKHEKRSLVSQKPSTRRLSTVRIAPPSRICSPSILKVRPQTKSPEAVPTSTPDTLSVLSALREKSRKRSAASTTENESSYLDCVVTQSSKRRRQESQQSNVSDSSMPLLPDQLPDLSASPAASLIQHNSTPPMWYTDSWVNSPGLKRSVNHLSLDSSRLENRPKRICGSGRANSILSSLSSSRCLQRDDSMANTSSGRDYTVLCTSQLKETDNRLSTTPSKSAAETSPTNKKRSPLSRADTLMLPSNEQNDTESSINTTTPANTTQKSSPEKFALSKNLSARKRNVSLYNSFNKTFAKAPKAVFVGSVEDYEADQDAEKKRVQQILDDISKDEEGAALKAKLLLKESQVKKNADTTQTKVLGSSNLTVPSSLSSIASSASTSIPFPSSLTTAANPLTNIAASSASSSATPASTGASVASAGTLLAPSQSILSGTSNKIITSTSASLSMGQTGSVGLSSNSKGPSSAGFNFPTSVNTDKKDTATMPSVNSVLSSLGTSNPTTNTATSTSNGAYNTTNQISFPSTTLGTTTGPQGAPNGPSLGGTSSVFGAVSSQFPSSGSKMGTAAAAFGSAGLTASVATSASLGGVFSSSSTAAASTAGGVQQGGVSSAPSFPSFASTPAVTSNAGSGESVKSAAAAFSFGQPSSSSNAVAPFTFGKEATNKTSGFSFTGSAGSSLTSGGLSGTEQKTVAPAPVFGAGTQSSASGFGSGSSLVSAGSSSSTSFSFTNNASQPQNSGAKSSESDKSKAFGSNNNSSQSSLFQFGSSQTKQEQPNSGSGFNFSGATKGNAAFNFGSSGTANKGSFAPASSSADKKNPPPYFGVQNSTQSFGGQNSMPSFGGQTVTPSFGGQSAPPSFGDKSSFSFAGQTPTFGSQNSSSNSSIGGQNPAPTFGAQAPAPSFGAVTSRPSFGGQTQTPSFGAQTPTPSFGGQTQTPSFGAQTPTPSFGGQTQAPSFGAQSPTPSFGGQSQTPTFGAQTPQNNMFGVVKTTPAKPRLKISAHRRRPKK